MQCSFDNLFAATVPLIYYPSDVIKSNKILEEILQSTILSFFL